MPVRKCKTDCGIHKIILVTAGRLLSTEIVRFGYIVSTWKVKIYIWYAHLNTVLNILTWSYRKAWLGSYMFLCHFSCPNYIYGYISLKIKRCSSFALGLDNKRETEHCISNTSIVIPRCTITSGLLCARYFFSLKSLRKASVSQQEQNDVSWSSDFGLVSVVRNGIQASWRLKWPNPTSLIPPAHPIPLPTPHAKKYIISPKHLEYK